MSCTTFAVTVSRAQDQSVAETARQERARKEKEQPQRQNSAKHVYTNEDLNRRHILTPEDRAAIEAKRNACAEGKNCIPALSQGSPAALDANANKPGTSLGEVARQYRKQKELQALKPKQTEPFHLPTAPAFASPVLPEPRAIHPLRPPVQPDLRPEARANIFKRDPFARVPLRPRVPLDVTSEIRPSRRGATPTAPKISSPPAPANRLTMQPTKPTIAPDFFAESRPAFRSAKRRESPRPPKFSSLHALASLPLEPGQPTPVVDPTRPLMAGQPNTFEPATPVAPVVTVGPALPAKSSLGSGSTREFVNVRRGDSLWKLAQERLGSGSRWPEIVAANRWISDPDQIRIGTELVLPVGNANVYGSRRGNGHGARTIKVRRGDTLWGLSKANLGHSAYWPCLAAANPTVENPNHIVEGQELLLPASCGPAAQGSLLPDER